MAEDVVMKVYGSGLRPESEAEKQFREKMQERLRTAMGDLMPDEVLAKVVERAIEENFFKREARRVERHWVGQREHVEEDPWVVRQVKTMLEKAVKEEVSAWMAKNQVRVAELVKEVIGDGIGVAVLRSMQALFQGTFDAFDINLRQRIEDIMRGRG